MKKNTLTIYRKIDVTITLGSDIGETDDIVIFGPIGHPVISQPNRPISPQKLVPQDYLILTTNNLQESADTFAEFKRQFGFNAVVVTKVSWTSDAIRECISEFNESLSNLKYILLLGNNKLLPGEYNEFTKGGKFYKVLTDQNYADLDYHSDRDVYRPQFQIGRIPAENTTQANIAISKIKTSQLEPATNTMFYEHPLLVSVFSDDELPSSHCTKNDGYEDRRFTRTAEDVSLFMSKQMVQKNYHYAGSYTPTHWSPYYYADNKPLDDVLLKKNGFPWTVTPATISGAINNGVPFVLFRGHGNEVLWGTSTKGLYTTNDINKLTNTNYPIILSIACSTGKYSSPNCMASSFMFNPNGGASGVIAASDLSFSGPNDYMVLGMFSTLYPTTNEPIPFNNNPYVRDTTATASSSQTLGNLLFHGLRSIKKYNHSYYNISASLFHIFGDPSAYIHFDGTDQSKLITNVDITSTLIKATCPGSYITLYNKKSGQITHYYNGLPEMYYPSINDCIVTVHNPYIKPIVKYGKNLPEHESKIESFTYDGTNLIVKCDLNGSAQKAFIRTTGAMGYVGADYPVDKATEKATVEPVAGVTILSLYVDDILTDSRRATIWIN